MIRAKIDLRQPVTYSGRGSRNNSVPKVRAVLHQNQVVARRRTGYGGWTDRPCREPPHQRPTQPKHARGASGARLQARTSAPTSLPRELGTVLFFMKSTRPAMDPEGYSTGERRVSLRVCAQHSPAVFGQVVCHERSRPCAVGMCRWTLPLDVRND
jgi:hypothetical protein